ncbi:hypothetical protein JT305_12000 [Salmonella enterica subsp. enterica serovar Senftenberg]|nr:hypothetical protein [Salmonella enterica subsp. enterica serovar Senftenberg]
MPVRRWWYRWDGDSRPQMTKPDNRYPAFRVNQTNRSSIASAFSILRETIA